MIMNWPMRSLFLSAILFATSNAAGRYGGYASRAVGGMYGKRSVLALKQKGNGGLHNNPIALGKREREPLSTDQPERVAKKQKVEESKENNVPGRPFDLPNIIIPTPSMVICTDRPDTPIEDVRLVRGYGGGWPDEEDSRKSPKANANRSTRLRKRKRSPPPASQPKQVTKKFKLPFIPPIKLPGMCDKPAIPPSLMGVASSSSSEEDADQPTDRSPKGTATDLTDASAPSGTATWSAHGGMFACGLLKRDRPKKGQKYSQSDSDSDADKPGPVKPKGMDCRRAVTQGDSPKITNLPKRLHYPFNFPGIVFEEMSGGGGTR